MVLQAGQGTHHVILAHDWRVAHTRACTHAHLKPAKTGVATLVAHESIQRFVVDVPAVTKTNVERLCCTPS